MTLRRLPVTYRGEVIGYAETLQKVATIALAHGARRTWYAHRASWIINIGPIPEGLSVLHRCDNPPCVNPDHLFLGTHRDNMDDMMAKKRHPGARKLTEEQVREIRARLGDDRSWRKMREIAREFSVHEITIYDIAIGRTWGGLPS